MCVCSHVCVSHVCMCVSHASVAAAHSLPASQRVQHGAGAGAAAGGQGLDVQRRHALRDEAARGGQGVQGREGLPAQHVQRRRRRVVASFSDEGLTH